MSKKDEKKMKKKPFLDFFFPMPLISVSRPNLGIVLCANQMAHRILTIFTNIVFEGIMICSTKQSNFLDGKSITFFIEIQISRF